MIIKNRLILNLNRRKDRLLKFINIIKSKLNIEIERVEAIDGR